LPRPYPITHTPEEAGKRLKKMEPDDQPSQDKALSQRTGGKRLLGGYDHALNKRGRDRKRKNRCY
jgi:hypothetical protein